MNESKWLKLLESAAAGFVLLLCVWAEPLAALLSR